MDAKCPFAARHDETPRLERGGRRIALLICSWRNVALGMMGAVVPGMLMTVFLIIAL